MSNKLPYLFASLMLSLLPGQVTADTDLQSFESFTGSISGNKVRIRTQPSLEGFVVRETTTGELFAVTDEKEGFYAIMPPKGTKGYIFRTFVLDGVVEGERVNIRLYPDTEAPIIGQLNKGEPINATLCATNNKWLEFDLPEQCTFFIAKEYVEKKGPVGLIEEIAKREREGAHLLHATLLFAQAEIQKPFAEIDLESINNKFRALDSAYGDLSDISEKASEAQMLLNDVYVQKKIAFLEDKNEVLTAAQKDRLAHVGIQIQQSQSEKKIADVGTAATHVLGLATSQSNDMTDKMLAWQPLEEALYHLWAATNGEGSIDTFYEEEKKRATTLCGIVEPYTRTVKNRPGDFLLRSEQAPVAFLYSTRVNLEKLVGKKVTILATPRPNNHFAFDAFFVISVE